MVRTVASRATIGGCSCGLNGRFTAPAREWRGIRGACHSIIAARRRQNVQQDIQHQTPLEVASKDGKLEIARTLIKYGADVNSRNRSGLTPLHTAAGYGHLGVVQLLLDKVADTNVSQCRGYTLLR